MMDKLETLLSSADGQARYIEWYQNEVTQLMLQELRERIRPRIESASTGMAAASELGRLKGMQESLDILTRYRGASQPSGAGLLSADYGAREMTEE